MINLHWLYVFAGAVFAGFAIGSARDEFALRHGFVGAELLNLHLLQGEVQQHALMHDLGANVVELLHESECLRRVVSLA